LIARASASPKPFCARRMNWRKRTASDWANFRFGQGLAGTVPVSPRPIYPDLEILTLSDALTFAASELRVEFPLMTGILAGKSPHDRAVELINGTRVRRWPFAVKFTRRRQGVLAANDPMIELARLVDWTRVNCGRFPRNRLK